MGWKEYKRKTFLILAPTTIWPLDGPCVALFLPKIGELLVVQCNLILFEIIEYMLTTVHDLVVMSMATKSVLPWRALHQFRARIRDNAEFMNLDGCHC
jgi:hypothetical protein